MTELDRSAQNQAQAANTTAATTGGNYGSAASTIGSSIIPTLTQQALHPTGFDPTTQGQMLTGAEQSLGGAAGSVAGEEGLRAARTRNVGSSAGILDQAARRNAQNLSGTTLDISKANAELGQKKQQNALGELSGLYGTDVGAQLKAMGLQPEDINAEVNAGKSGWLQNTFGTLGDLGNAAGSVIRGLNS